MQRIHLFTLLALSLSLASCDQAPHSTEAPAAEPRFTAVDYQQALDSLAQAPEPDSSAAAREAQVLAQDGERLSPQEALDKTLEAASPAQRTHIERLLRKVRRSRSLEEIERGVGAVTRRARRTLEGEELQHALEARAIVLGAARFWQAEGKPFTRGAAETPGDCAPSLQDGAQTLVRVGPGCDPVPVSEDYKSFYMALSAGIAGWAAVCGVAVGAMELITPIGTIAGCAYAANAAGGVAMIAERERQHQNWMRAVRRWCRECRGEHWKNARFCAKVLPN